MSGRRYRSMRWMSFCGLWVCPGRRSHSGSAPGRSCFVAPGGAVGFFQHARTRHRLDYHAQLGPCRDPAPGRQAGEAWMENNLGNAYRGLGHFDEALRHFHHALAHSEVIGDRRGEGWTRYNIGDTYRELGRLEEALNHLRRALIIGREVGERWSEGYTLNMIGDSYRCHSRPCPWCWPRWPGSSPLAGGWW